MPIILKLPYMYTRVGQANKWMVVVAARFLTIREQSHRYARTKGCNNFLLQDWRHQYESMFTLMYIQR